MAASISLCMCRSRLVLNCFRKTLSPKTNFHQQFKHFAALCRSQNATVTDDKGNNSNLIPAVKLCTETEAETKRIPGDEPKTPVKGLPLEDKKKGELVYYGVFTRQTKLVKMFSISTSVIALSLQPFILPNVQKLPAVLQIALGGALSIFLIGTPLMIHSLTRHYITDMYYNKDTNEFTLATLNFFCQRRETKFIPEDATFPPVSLLGNMKVKGKKLFLDPALFRDRHAYIKLMRYDEPMDMFEDDKK